MDTLSAFAYSSSVAPEFLSDTGDVNKKRKTKLVPFVWGLWNYFWKISKHMISARVSFSSFLK
jgi:hypothetical protein